MADSQDWPSLAKPDAEYEEALKQIGGQLPDLGAFPDIQSMRDFIAKMKANASAALAPKLPDVKEDDHQVAMRDGEKITCRVYQPATPASGGSPLAVIYHGGGWCIGELVNEEPLCRLLTSKLCMVVVNVDYRLAPEHKFPTAVYDAYDATRWAAEKASSFGADPSKGFVVGGTSAGANLAAVISHEWRDNKQTPKLTGTHLMIPPLCTHADYPEQYRKDYQSWDQLEHAPILSRKACELFINNYIPDTKDRSDPKFSPLLYETGHKDLPPTYSQICGMDPLRDDGLIYERVLREEVGVKTKVDMYPGVPHGFWSMLPHLKISQKFAEDSVKGVKWLLEQQ